MKIAFLIHFFAFSLAQMSFGAVRSVTMKGDDLLTVKTALGIATIVQTPSVIQSAIIGDQSGFKVEYLEKAVTIKPLRYGVRTNLYLMTEKRRFNLRLVTIPQDAADYIVYLKESETISAPLWTKLTLTKTGKDLNLSITRISTTPMGFFLIEGRLTSKRPLSIKPEYFWIKQGTESKTIQHLYLSDTSLSASRPVLFGVSLGKGDLQERRPLILELRGPETLPLTIAESLVWK